MPPRRKNGLGRIDAAVCALGQMGYSRQIVVKTIKQLLKVYGTDEAWVVIEEGCYTMVIEKIIEDEENQKLIEDTAVRAREGQSDGDAAVGCHRATSDTEMLGQAPTIEDTQRVDSESFSSMVAAAGCYTGHTEILTANQLPATKDTSIPALEGQSDRDVAAECHRATIEKEMLKQASAIKDTQSRDKESPSRIVAAADCYTGATEILTSSQVPAIEVHVLAPRIAAPPRPRRSPCYGWISETESDSDSKEEHSIVASIERKRKQRWDVRSYESYSDNKDGKLPMLASVGRNQKRRWDVRSYE